MKLFMKYMLTNQSKIFVKAELKKLGLHFIIVDLGEIEIMEELSADQLLQLREALLILSSQDIDVAVNCMHHKAFDYVVKSETAFLRLQKFISTIFQYKKMEKELTWYMERM